MTGDIIAAVISGIISGALSGAAASSIYIRRTHSSSAGSHSQAVTGMGNQPTQAGGGGQAASSRRGNVTQTIHNEAVGRKAQLIAAVTRSIDKGLPKQSLVLRNVGDAPADGLALAPDPSGGGFTAQPNWQAYPKGLGAGQQAGLPCVTSGAGLVTFIVSFIDDGSAQGPIVMEAAHEDHSI
jgi:hypothetical protein